MNTRLIFMTAALPAAQARAIVTLMCRNQTSTFERTRQRMQKRFKSQLVRVLNFAKHETLRKAHRYLHSHRAIVGQDQPEDQPQQHPGTVKIAFNLDELRQDLGTLLSGEAPLALDTAAGDTLTTVGYRDPWKLPAQATLDFISRRRNLLSNVPDEIFQRIKDVISEGLNAGDSISQLSDRITQAFDEIEQGRAEVIAENETAAAYSFASNQAARAAGIQYKKWLHGNSKVPRPDHLAIDGLVVPFDEPYPVGNPPLMYPHDENGSPDDVINCSCISGAATKAEYEAQ